MVLLMKITDTMEDNEPFYYDIDDPEQCHRFRKYLEDTARMTVMRDAYPGDRVVIECVRRDD